MTLTTETTHSILPAAAVSPNMAKASQHSKRETSSALEERGEKKGVSEKDAQKIARDLNSALKSFNTELNFTVDKETDKMVVKIVNSKTHEVIRQIPAEDALRIASHISKLLGLLVDENA